MSRCAAPSLPALRMDAALDELKKYTGARYDSGVLAVCVKPVEEEGFLFTP